VLETAVNLSILGIAGFLNAHSDACTVISFATRDLYLQYLHIKGNGVSVTKSFEQNIFLNRYFCTENSVQSEIFCSLCYVYCGGELVLSQV
jgi:hypothetical protein